MEKPTNHRQQVSRAFPGVFAKIQCSICMVPYDAEEVNRYPFYLCQNHHTVCKDCIQNLLKKYSRDRQFGSCPYCRGAIISKVVSAQGNTQYVKFQKNQQIIQLTAFVNYQTNLVTQLQKQLSQEKLQYQKQLIQVNAKLNKRQRQQKFKDMEINQLKRKNIHLLSINQLQKQQKIYKQKPIAIKASQKFMQSLQTDVQIDKQEYKQNNKSHDNIFQNNKDLFQFNEELIKQTRLSLARNYCIRVHMINLVKNDLSNIIQLNLNFNQIGNQGLDILCRQGNFKQLRILQVSNNRITQITRNIKNINFLEIFKFGNLSSGQQIDQQNFNLINKESLMRILEVQWTKLIHITFEVYTDKFWDNQEFSINFIRKLPNLIKLGISQSVHTLTKKRLGQMGNKLNSYAFRQKHPKISMYHQL